MKVPEPELSVTEKIQAQLTLADAYLYLDAAKAVAVIEPILSTRGQVLDEGNRLLAYTGLGIAYTMQHRYEKAREALNLAMGIDGECIPAIETLGRVYYSNYQLESAKRIFEETLAKKRKISGEQYNRDIDHTLFELSVVQRLCGSYQEASESLSGILNRFRCSYQQPDLGVAHVLLELGRTEAASGNDTKASLHYQASLKEVLVLREQYETFFRENDIPSYATEFLILEQFVTWNQCCLGELEMKASKSSQEASHFTTSQCHLESALEQQRNIYKRYKGGSGEDMDIALCLLLLGELWLSKDLKCSEKYLRDSLSMQRCLLGEQYPHATTAKTLCALAELALKKNEIAHAKELLSQAIFIYIKIYNNQNHPDVIAANNLFKLDEFHSGYSSAKL